MRFSLADITEHWAKSAGLTCHRKSEVGSTNTWAKESVSKEDQALSIYLADHQTNGRGRGERTWTDQGHGDFLLSSWSFQLRETPQPVLAPAIGLALFKAAHATWLGFPWSLKAPNDLYLGENKVAGLLIESIQEGNRFRLIVGLGMNVFSNPKVDRSGSLSEQIPAEELHPEIWQQFLDRLLLELTSTLLLAGNVLLPIQRRGLTVALNHFPQTRDIYAGVHPDGSLQVKDGPKISWFDL